MEASGWLLETRISEAGNKEAQMRVRDKRSRLRGGGHLETFWPLAGGQVPDNDGLECFVINPVGL